jgi:hypothetical protein
LADFGTQLDHEGRIKGLEVIVEDHSRKLNSLNLIEQAVSRISFVLEQIQKDASKRDEFIEKQNKLLLQVYEDSQDTKDSVEELEGKVDDLISKVNESECKNIIKIDTRDIIKNIFKKFILPIGALAAIAVEVLRLLKII